MVRSMKKGLVRLVLTGTTALVLFAGCALQVTQDKELINGKTSALSQSAAYNTGGPHPLSDYGQDY